MSRRYQEIAKELRRHYDATAQQRDCSVRAPWKLKVRENFTSLLRSEEKRKLLEIGAGPGSDSLFFQSHGLEVVASDLSPEMVEHCRQKGLRAVVADFLSLDFPDESMDAIYAFNCLLHVPRADLPAVLANLHRMLRAGGLINVVTYGGVDREGTFVEGGFEEGRFLSYYGKETLLKVYTALFEVVHVTNVETGEHERPLAYSLVLRKRSEHH